MKEMSKEVTKTLLAPGAVNMGTAFVGPGIVLSFVKGKFVVAWEDASHS